jgi:predicted phosphodiesterase
VPAEIPNGIVTYRSMLSAVTQHESAVSAAVAQKADEMKDPWAQAAMMARLGAAIESVAEREQNEGGPDVMTSPQNADASRMQASMSQMGAIMRELPAGGHELKFDERTDAFGWIWSVISEWNGNAHDIVRPKTGDPLPLPPGDIKIALMSDWGTGLYGAPVMAATIQNKCQDFNFVVHLGDVYYAGAEKEMQQRFLDLWPKCPKATSLAINGNHEMYSGGWAYFDKTLPAFNQKSSYLAYQNEDWLIAYLDTAYLDFNLDETQSAWLKNLVKNAGDRRVMLMSHHQLFSQLDSQGPKLASTLTDLIHDKAIDFWYWGHEHRCVVYDKADSGIVARCIGHAGMPQRRGKERDAPSEIKVGNMDWRRLAAKPLVSPSALILDGPNDLIPGNEKTYSPHGYVTLQISGKKLHEEYFLPDGTRVLQLDF